MTKADLERIVGLFLDAAPEIVASARRTRNGACMICGAPRGAQHDPGCAIWKLIDARISYRVADEGPNKPTAPINRTEVMRVLEGAEYSPAAPTLALTEIAVSKKGLPF
ncbi:MAG: hypothetical protein IH905_13760 [Proteobacteria bacterium]|nr:hypothetical protein [Pseudomonadota bacterium]